jgi:hypothetical protein
MQNSASCTRLFTRSTNLETARNWNEHPSPSDETYCTEYRANVSETESVKLTASILEEFLVAAFYHLNFHPKGTNDIHV